MGGQEDDDGSDVDAQGQCTATLLHALRISLFRCPAGRSQRLTDGRVWIAEAPGGVALVYEHAVAVGAVVVDAVAGQSGRGRRKPRPTVRGNWRAWRTGGDTLPLLCGREGARCTIRTAYGVRRAAYGDRRARVTARCEGHVPGLVLAQNEFRAMREVLQLDQKGRQRLEE